MNILFIDDCPKEKVIPLIEYLKAKNIEFTYEIDECVNSAIKYIFPKFNTLNNEIDLIITDLGLPRYEDGSDYGLLNGLDIIDELIRKDVSIPVIINSATKIPNLHEYAKIYQKNNRFFSYVESLTGLWLENYITKYIN